MRRALSVLLLASVAACEPDEILPTSVAWMDWPAEVVAGEPFTVRMVVYWPCAAGGFRAGPTADQSAVTFSPYFLSHNDQVLCAGVLPVTTLVAGTVDTAGLAPGLPAEFARTYEIRAATDVYAPPPSGALAVASQPVRTFGAVTVRLQAPAPGAAVRNAAGRVSLQVDTLGCARVRPSGLYAAGSAIVLENPIDTAGLSGAFVRGYIYEPAAPVCGENTVFHLVSRN
jgi:hypothetical protein